LNELSTNSRQARMRAGGKEKVCDGSSIWRQPWR
jgi:hypothetical protein